MVKKIKFLTDDITPVLSLVGTVVAQKATLEVLNHIRIVTKKENDGRMMVEFMASDGDMWLKMFQSHETCDDGICVCVEAKSLLVALRNLSGKDVVLSVDEDKGTILCEYGNGNFVLPFVDATTFPMPTLDGEFTTIGLPSNRLRDAIAKTECAVSTDELHPVMSGIRFEFTNNAMVSVATDGRKLIKCTDTLVNSGYIPDACFTLPQKACKAISNVLSSIDDCDVTVKFNERIVTLWCATFAFVTRLVDGRYPNYEAVIPRDNTKIATLNKSNFIGAMRRVSIMGNATSELVVLSLSKDTMTINAEDLDFSKAATETIPCNYDGEEFKIGFKSSMLITLLGNIDGDDVILSFKDATRACLITPKNGDASKEYISLIMPLLINAQ